MFEDYAPFTDAEVAALRKWQTCGWVHPFTCCDHVTMNVETHGFVCPKCGRVQIQCHDFMLTGPGQNPLDGLKITT